MLWQGKLPRCVFLSNPLTENVTTWNARSTSRIYQHALVEPWSFSAVSGTIRTETQVQGDLAMTLGRSCLRPSPSLLRS